MASCRRALQEPRPTTSHIPFRSSSESSNLPGPLTSRSWKLDAMLLISCRPEAPSLRHRVSPCAPLHGQPGGSRSKRLGRPACAAAAFRLLALALSGYRVLTILMFLSSFLHRFCPFPPDPFLQLPDSCCTLFSPLFFLSSPLSLHGPPALQPRLASSIPSLRLDPAARCSFQRQR